MSLIGAVLAKFPATVWLTGSPFVTEAALRFVSEHPPGAPCIAEYGERFPQFLSARPGAERLPYLREFAELEWHAGHAAVAADEAPVTLDDFLAIDRTVLPETAIVLQSGVRYLKSSWPVDDLLRLYLTDSAPERFAFEPGEVWLEIRGSRGEFDIHRLDAPEYIFRKFISEGRPIGEAADSALDVGAAFDPGQALVKIITEGLGAALR